MFYGFCEATFSVFLFCFYLGCKQNVMAVYLNNSLIKSGDFIRTTRQYSSAQSLNRAKKKETKYVIAIGRMHFVYANAVEVAKLYSVDKWEGLPLIETVPAGLSPLSKISKKIKLGETVILSWALLNRMDVYWIAGTFFAHLQAAEQIAHTEKKRINALTIPPKVRNRRRYLS